MPHTLQALRFERLSPPELSAEEQEIYQSGIAQGMYQALIDYPALITHEKTLFDMAATVCQEEDQRKRTIFLSNWASGYFAAVQSSQKDRAQLAAAAPVISAMPREQAVLFLLSQLNGRDPFLSKFLSSK
jgi:hypothetical protein